MTLSIMAFIIILLSIKYENATPSIKTHTTHIRYARKVSFITSFVFFYIVMLSVCYAERIS